MTMPTENDAPRYRGTNWIHRRDEILSRDNKVCQRCEDHNRQYEHYPVCLEVHHVVKGKHLPVQDSRIGLNLVAVCSECHGKLEREGVTVEQQFREIGQKKAADVLSALKEEQCTAQQISEYLECSLECSVKLLQQLERLKLVKRSPDDYYEPGDLAVTEWWA